MKISRLSLGDKGEGWYFLLAGVGRGGEVYVREARVEGVFNGEGKERWVGGGGCVRVL
ncbi:MAG: hypothetical protein N2035_09365 [Chthoniobacterales bacterium]|nr:hypothetical protein [Chthoniobacterales bacterium]